MMASEATILALQAAPDRVFLTLRNELSSAFAELTPGQAIQLRADLSACIDVALASRTPH